MKNATDARFETLVGKSHTCVYKIINHIIKKQSAIQRTTKDVACKIPLSSTRFEYVQREECITKVIEIEQTEQI